MENPEADAIPTPTITQNVGRKRTVTLPIVAVNSLPEPDELNAALQFDACNRPLSFYILRRAYKFACVGLIQPTHLFASKWVIDHIETSCKPYDYRRTHVISVNGRPCNITPAGFDNFFWAAKIIPWGPNDQTIAFFTHRPKTPESENCMLTNFDIGVCLARGITMPEYPKSRETIIKHGLKPLIENGKWKTYWAVESGHNVHLSSGMCRQMAKMIEEGVWGDIVRNHSNRE